jgi:hypothetical protein
MGGIMKYAIKMGLDAMIYIQSFIQIGSGIQKLIGGDIQTNRQDRDRLSLGKYAKKHLTYSLCLSLMILRYF